MSISIIGLGVSYDDLTEKHLSMIGNADVLAGGARHLGYFPRFSGTRIEITTDVKGLVREIETLSNTGKTIVVLASGDPLFYGIGSYLTRMLGREKVRIYPNISSVAAAFSKIGEPWHDAKVISLHGRSLEEKHIYEFKTYDKLSVLTGGEHSPSWLFAKLEAHHIQDFHICVLERLGDEKESVKWFRPGEKIDANFTEPNIVILLRKSSEEKSACPRVYSGMPDELFCHEHGLITKPEVRVVALSKLMPENDSIMWDLGAGSGSVSIEASLRIKEGHIFAVEKNENRIRDIRENQRRFNVANLSAVHGHLPEKIEELPHPDRIFIGGGGKALPLIIEAGAKRLLKNGIMVVNTVLLKNMAGALEKMERLGFDTEIVQVNISYGHKMPWDLMLKSRNPVFIIKGCKQ